MAYDPSNQFRCDIVRTRAKLKIDDLLPAYARIIHELCPCTEADFVEPFNNELKAYLQTLGCSVDRKALNNHRTETAKSLFGMYYIDQMGIVHESERTEKYLRDGDQPAFFKDFCYKMQFPNGMTKRQKLAERISESINIYPYRFLLAVLQKALKEGVTLNIREIGYYVFNAKDVLSGRSRPEEVVAKVKYDQRYSIRNDINTGRNRPWDWEHIEGLINYLELANLIAVNGKKKLGHERTVTINSLEAAAIKRFVDDVACPLEFNVTGYSLATIADRKRFQLDWDRYNASLSKHYTLFYTSPAALGIAGGTGSGRPARRTDPRIAIGKVGESYVFNYEVGRIQRINPTYVPLVRDRSAERGIGYDIESIHGSGASPTSPKYIEVKTTTRVTQPSKKHFLDSLNITRNEWKAAQEHTNDYFIYRVYLTRGKVFIYVIGNLVDKRDRELLQLSAPLYEMKFDVKTSGLVDDTINI